jgi:hypothetical protein
MFTRESLEENGEYDEAIDELVNPFNAVTISRSLADKHCALVDKDTWIMANAQLISRIGSEVWLAHLLDVLETGRLPRDGDSAAG